jgi:hypothetical protein
MVAKEVTNSVGESRLYQSKIIKAGALLADTKTLLAQWDEAVSVAENLDRFRRENLFGKASRSRVEDILAIFRQRYLTSEPVTKALVTLVKDQFSAVGLTCIFYFHATRADALLHDVVTEVLMSLQNQGKRDIDIKDIVTPLACWVAEEKTAGHWSEPTLVRVAQGLMATLRDFGVLQGVIRKRVAPMYLPVEAFAYVAFYLHQTQPSGERLLGHPEWRIVRKGAQKLSRASAILHELSPETFETKDSWAHAQRNRDAAITVSRVVERTFELMSRRRPGKALVFIIDEVGQHVARSGDKIEDLRATVEEFGKVGKNLLKARKIKAPCWIVVTSQEMLDVVVAAIDA